MNLVIPLWCLPLVLTVVCLYLVFRPPRTPEDYYTNNTLRIIWFIPPVIGWLAYLCVHLALKR